MKLFDEIKAPWYRPLVYYFCWTITRLVIYILYRGRFTGRQHIPKTGPVLMVSNHQSNLDPPMVGVLPGRMIRILAKSELFRFPPFGWLIWTLGAVSINRDGSGLDGIKKTLRLLKAGEPVLVFPEGARSWDGEIQPFMAGIVTLARRSKAAIVPMTIEGAYDVFPRGARRPKLFGPRINIAAGPAISAEEVASLGEQELVELLDQKVRELNEEVRSRPAIKRQIERRRKRFEIEGTPAPDPEHPDDD